MKKRNVKRIFTYIVSLMLLLILTSCAKVVRVEDTPIQVKVIDANYSSSYTRVTPIIVNNNVIMCNQIIPVNYKRTKFYDNGKSYKDVRLDY